MSFVLLIILVIAYLGAISLAVEKLGPLLEKRFPVLSNGVIKIGYYFCVISMAVGVLSIFVWPALEFLCPNILDLESGNVGRICLWDG